uniref:Uncharacterized protein n=1 Tax=Timema monikensis TaxID=170555 RepID=A0A7R9HMV3_9NEOP|nr:unnamed protein product [Timema monikensis]
MLRMAPHPVEDQSTSDNGTVKSCSFVDPYSNRGFGVFSIYPDQSHEVSRNFCKVDLKLDFKLNLGNNVFSNLPSDGLNRLLHLKTFNNPKLREFPSPENFPRIQSLVLSYAYHCCAFLPLTPAESPPKPPLHESVLFPTDNEFDHSLWNSSGLTDIWPQLKEISAVTGLPPCIPFLSPHLPHCSAGMMIPRNYQGYPSIPPDPSAELVCQSHKASCLPLPGISPCSSWKVVYE